MEFEEEEEVEKGGMEKGVNEEEGCVSVMQIILSSGKDWRKVGLVINWDHHACFT
jgi:hypothetical protein